MQCDSQLFRTFTRGKKREKERDEIVGQQLCLYSMQKRVPKPSRILAYLKEIRFVPECSLVPGLQNYITEIYNVDSIAKISVSNAAFDFEAAAALVEHNAICNILFIRHSLKYN